MIGQFWQLILAFQNKSITWLCACRVKQIWQACDALICHTSGVDPGFFLGGVALVSWSTSTPINTKVFFLKKNTSCIRKPQVISGGGGMHTPCTLSLDPPMHILTLWREERFFRKWAWVQMIRCTHLCMFNCYKTIGLRRSWKYCFKRINNLHDCRCRLGKYTAIVHMVFSYVRIQLSL